jgi:hypothetical protein
VSLVPLACCCGCAAMPFRACFLPRRVLLASAVACGNLAWTAFELVGCNSAQPHESCAHGLPSIGRTLTCAVRPAAARASFRDSCGAAAVAAASTPLRVRRLVVAVACGC